MSANELLLLGLLGQQRMHGYELHDFLEKRLGFVSDMKKPTAYRLLDSLHEQGLVEREVEKPGRRPERRVYHLTPKGRERFLALLRQELPAASLPVYSSNVALLFVNQLPPGERRELLGRRLAALEEWRVRLSELVARHPSGTTARLVLEHDLAHLEAEQEWLARTVSSLDQIRSLSGDQPEAPVRSPDASERDPAGR
jgi:DNA-binding PadR family transcriptional regulator